MGWDYHRNMNVNGDIKQILHDEEITHAQIAAQVGYCTGTIHFWMRHPLTDYQREVVMCGIEGIRKDRLKKNKR